MGRELGRRRGPLAIDDVVHVQLEPRNTGRVRDAVVDLDLEWIDGPRGAPDREPGQAQPGGRAAHASPDRDPPRGPITSVATCHSKLVCRVARAVAPRLPAVTAV